MSPSNLTDIMKQWYAMTDGENEMVVHCQDISRAIDMWQEKHGYEPLKIEAIEQPLFKSASEGS